MVIANDHADLDAAWERGLREHGLWLQLHDALLAVYPEQYVAIATDDGRVLDADADLNALLERIDGRGVARTARSIRLLTRKPRQLIL
ncbi:MAG TPA: hypothetical protein VFK32_03675 [Tepidiformaceae bacterium]|nr:hypothetical protein [Tepidiformaceae bacterium]